MAHLKYLYSTKCLSEGQLHTKLQRINCEIFVLPLAPPQQESVAHPTPGLASVVHLTPLSRARESQGIWLDQSLVCSSSHRPAPSYKPRPTKYWNSLLCIHPIDIKSAWGSNLKQLKFPKYKGTASFEEFPKYKERASFEDA